MMVLCMYRFAVSCPISFMAFLFDIVAVITSASRCDLLYNFLKNRIYRKQECIQSSAHRPLQDRNPNTYNLILE